MTENQQMLCDIQCSFLQNKNIELQQSELSDYFIMKVLCIIPSGMMDAEVFLKHFTGKYSENSVIKLLLIYL